jgi:hypothetical protein
MTSTASMTSVASMTSTASTVSIHQNICWTWWLDHPKWTVTVPFCGIDHQNSNFSLIPDTFLLEAVEVSRCYFFKNWSLKLKFPILLKPLWTII